MLRKGFEMPAIDDIASKRSPGKGGIPGDIDIESLYPQSSDDEEEFMKNPKIFSEASIKKMRRKSNNFMVKEQTSTS